MAKYLLYENGDYLGFTDSYDLALRTISLREVYFGATIGMKKVKSVPYEMIDNYFEIDPCFDIPLNGLEAETFLMVMDQLMTDMYYKVDDLMELLEESEGISDEGLKFLQRYVAIMKRPHTEIYENDRDYDYSEYFNMIEAERRFYSRYYSVDVPKKPKWNADIDSILKDQSNKKKNKGKKGKK